MLEAHVGGVIGRGGRHVLIPIEAVVEATPEIVRLGQTRGHVQRPPSYDPQLIVPPERDVYSPYFG